MAPGRSPVGQYWSLSTSLRGAEAEVAARVGPLATRGLVDQPAAVRTIKACLTLAT